MAVRERAEIAAALQRKGFVPKQRELNRDHDYYFLQAEGLLTPIFTKLSHGSSYKTYGKELLGAVSRQLKLTNAQLLQLIDCSMSAAEYLSILKKNGVIR